MGYGEPKRKAGRPAGVPRGAQAAAAPRTARCHQQPEADRACDQTDRGEGGGAGGAILQRHPVENGIGGKGQHGEGGQQKQSHGASLSQSGGGQNRQVRGRA